MLDTILTKWLFQGSTFFETKHLAWAYCAPEVFFAHPEIIHGTTAAPTGAATPVPAATSMKSDVWSVGIVLYVLLSGIHPFDPDGRHTRDQIIAKIQEGTFSLTEPLWGSISREAKAMLVKLLSPSPEDRPSATEALSHEWFECSHTPRTSLSVSITNGLGVYQRTMQRKFRVSVACNLLRCF